jgi:hypothetical protein
VKPVSKCRGSATIEALGLKKRLTSYFRLERWDLKEARHRGVLGVGKLSLIRRIKDEASRF